MNWFYFTIIMFLLITGTYAAFQGAKKNSADLNSFSIACFSIACFIFAFLVLIGLGLGFAMNLDSTEVQVSHPTSQPGEQVKEK